MGWAKANKWCTASARAMASEIAGVNGLYCGPAVVGWIAAVWNIDVKGRPYDYLKRLKDRALFPKGPRKFFGKPPGFERSLNDILQRETEGDLRLSESMLHKYGSIHSALEKYDRPIIICMYPDAVTLHYATLYKSEKKEKSASLRDPIALDEIKFYWQDNGLLGGEGNPGLSSTGWRKVGQSVFTWGASRVVLA